MKRLWIACMALVFAMSCISGTVWAQGVNVKESDEQKVTMKDLPNPVLQTVQEQSKKGTLIGLSKEVEGEETFYEAEMKINGHGKDILIDAGGKVIEIEEEVALEGLPAPIKSEINKSVGSAKILKLESISKDDKLQFYEAQIEKAGKESEVKMGPDGKLLADGK